jgi:hypothetical protein
MALPTTTEIKQLKDEEVTVETMSLLLGSLALYLAYRRFALKRKLAAR